MKETIQETNDICITHIIWLVLMMKNLNMQSASVQCELRLVFSFFVMGMSANLKLLLLFNIDSCVCVCCVLLRAPLEVQTHNTIPVLERRQRMTANQTITHLHTITAKLRILCGCSFE